MKRKIFISIFVFVIFIAIYNKKVDAALIETIDFENGYSVDNMNFTYNKKSISIDNNKGINNSGCLKLKNDDYIISQAGFAFENLDNNTRYYITAYVKSVNIEKENMQEDSDGGASIWTNSFAVSGMSSSGKIEETSEYQKVTLSAYPVDNKIEIISEIRNSKGEFYIDNIQISSIDSINILSNQGKVLVKVDQDMVDQVGINNLNKWANNMQTVYIDLHELTTVTPATRSENGPIIFDIMLGENEKRPGAAAYSSLGGVIFSYKESMIASFNKCFNRDEKDWMYGMIHELGHQFDFGEAWDFESEEATNFKLAYVAEKEQLKLGPAEISESKYNEIYNNGGGIMDVMKELAEIYGYLGSPSKYGRYGQFKNCSPFGDTYKFLLIKEAIGWDAVKKAYASTHETYGNDSKLTKTEKLDIWVNELSKQSGKSVKSLFSTVEWDALMDYFGEFEDTQVKTVNLDKNELKVSKVGYKILTASMDINEGILDWTSENPDIARVVDGKVIAVKEGITTITAKSRNSGAYATCKIITDMIAPSIEKISITPTALTNQNVVVKVQASDNLGLDNKAYSFDGGKTWQLDNSKTYTQNENEIVIQVRDEAGNITTAKAFNITQIDKDGPKLSVNYNMKSAANREVIVEIFSDEEIQEVQGFILSPDKKVLRKVYTENAKEETIIVKDLLGNESKVVIKIPDITEKTEDEKNSSDDINYNNANDKKPEIEVVEKDTLVNAGIENQSTLKELPYAGNSKIIIVSIIALIIIATTSWRLYKRINI